MKSYTSISVIICIYNGKDTLDKAIDSIINQNYPNDKYELILINDGSKDCSDNICKTYLKLEKCIKIKYMFKNNDGLAAARNSGIKLSENKYIAYIDQDAIATKNWLKNINEVIISANYPAAIGGKVETMNKFNVFSNIIHWIHYYKESVNGEEEISLIGTNMIFSKELFNKVGGFYNQFKNRGDDNSFLILKVLPNYKLIVASNAIVMHEWPWDFKQWIKERYCNGHEYALIWLIMNKKEKTSLKLFIYSAFRLFCLLAPYLFLLSITVCPDVCNALFLFILIPFIYRTYLRSNFVRKSKILVREFGVKSSIYKIPYAFAIITLGYVWDDHGYIKGLFDYYNTNIDDDIDNSDFNEVINNFS